MLTFTQRARACWRTDTMVVVTERRWLSFQMNQIITLLQNCPCVLYTGYLIHLIMIRLKADKIKRNQTNVSPRSQTHYSSTRRNKQQLVFSIPPAFIWPQPLTLAHIGGSIATDGSECHCRPLKPYRWASFSSGGGNEAKVMECLFSDISSLRGLIRAELGRRQVLI